MARKIVVRIALALLGFYLVACAAMYFAQRQILFPADTRDVALDVGLVPRADVVELHTSDGETLKAWWVPPANDQPVYLYLHGNAETLATRDGRFGLLTNAGAGLLGVSWRGYGGSTGSPSEAGLRLDAVAAYEWLREQGITPKRLIIFGESIGTGIATWLSSHQPSAALVLDSPYTAIYRIAQRRYPWLPVTLLSRDPLDSLQWAGAITVPVFVFHCTGDRIVPYAMGEELFAALASQDKQLERIDRECHVPSVQPLMAQFRELERKVVEQRLVPP
jgi:fermentation-respiration switch protein FrsA (DUF1100 family)